MSEGVNVVEPLVIYVHGMPLMFRGWNGAYEKKTRISVTRADEDLHEEIVEYHLKNHTYYCIGIKHTKIVKEKEGGWTLRINDSSYSDGAVIYRTASDNVEGDWGDILVTSNNDVSTWVRSNWVIASITTVAVLVICNWF
jgi:hypothetical protein